jgi:acid phosphatase family membrane protein YuiD
MKMIYLITPFVAWVIAGTVKFILNCLKEKKIAFHLIGYGGFPSNHSAIVSSSASLIYFDKGLSDPAFCVAITLAFIVFLDANSLRGQIEKQAKAINILNASNKTIPKLRERIGHTKIEVLGGALLGVIIGAFIHYISISA